jgi:transcriptional antiterminator RfaH
MIWSVAQTESTRERTAQRWLCQAEFETYLPLVNGKIRPNPLFPGYLFIRIGSTGWSCVENTIGVLQLLRSSGGSPARIEDRVIEEIQAREHNGVVRLPERPRWRQGDRVRIGNQTFLGHIGLFDGMAARDRVFVLLNLFGRQTRVKLPVGDLRELC